MNFRDELLSLTRYTEGMRVLYVEDDLDILENTATLFNNFFPSVQTATNGKEGLELYRNHPFDLVITDIIMPEMNGIEMIREIRTINTDQTVVVTSACDESQYLLDLINLGISRFIVKPLRMEQMIQTLHDVSKNHYNAKKVAEFTETLKHDLTHQSTLLEEYKEIVDVSTIVSKTDLKGKITYANEAFCTISGYRQDELLGKSHNIVRHPDVPSEVFKELWNTIQNKKVWHGVIKNRKKDGGYYITESTIKPILDEHGEILEYISIRHDVTELFDLNQEIWDTQHEMLYMLGEIGETRSQETGNHVRRVAKYSQLLAQLSGMHPEEIKILYTASPMHDIGKIGIPDAILLKPGRLDETEFEIMKTHASIGHDILKNSKRPILLAAAIVAHEHHEKWDGSGYPRGLRGEEIHIYGRISVLADVFDALSCKRVYKEPWPLEKILTLIHEERGKHFDPRLVDLFLANIEKFLLIADEYR